jgi:hypothetical protein
VDYIIELLVDLKAGGLAVLESPKSPKRGGPEAKNLGGDPLIKNNKKQK